MEWNAADIHHLPFQYDLLYTAVKKNLGIIAMKVVSKGQIFRDDSITSMVRAFGYVCSFTISTAILEIATLDELENNVEVARNFQRYNEQEMHGQ